MDRPGAVGGEPGDDLVPEGFAHGFQTLADDSEVFYQISAFYAPEASRGIRWDDPDLAIDWPQIEECVISERDNAFPLYRDTTDHPAA